MGSTSRDILCPAFQEMVRASAAVLDQRDQGYSKIFFQRYVKNISLGISAEPSFLKIIEEALHTAPDGRYV